MTADTVFIGGSVITMDRRHPAASAVAIGGGRILAVGDDPEALDLASSRSRRVDLAGRTLLPGFGDAHCHPVSAAVTLQRCSLHEVDERLDAYQLAIREYAAGHP